MAIKRALSVDDIERKKYRELHFDGDWKKFLGTPEASGSWIIWGESGHGKSRFTMMLVKALAQFGKVAYNSLEEGSRKTMQKNIVECGIRDVKRNFILLNKEPIEDLKERLRRKQRPSFVVIDSAQYTWLNKRQYKAFVDEFTDILFIWISHADGKKPDGSLANLIKYDSDIKIRVEGYKAFSTNRMADSTPYIIWPEGAAQYYADIK